MSEDLYLMSIPVIFAIALALSLLMMIIIFKLAVDRGRSVLSWILLSFVLSPVIVIIILSYLGETDEKRRSRIYREEVYRSRERKMQAGGYNRSERG